MDADSLPGDVADALGTLLLRGPRVRLYDELTAGLAPQLDHATYPVISGLGRTGPRSAAALAAEIGLDRTVVSRHAKRLVDGGLIERLPDPADGRASLLRLTDAGERVVVTLRARFAAIVGAYLATWPRDDAERFAQALLRFADEGPFAPTPER